MKGLNRKAAYDLGRKAIYFTVAILIITIIFVIVSNYIDFYQRESLKYLPQVMDLAYVAGIEKCMSQKDNERIYPERLAPELDINLIKECLEKNEILKDKEFRIVIEGEPPIETSNFTGGIYEKYFFHKNKLKKVTIEVEQSEFL